MSEIGIYQVDAAWAPAGHEGVEPHPMSFLVFQGIGDKKRAAVVLRVEEKERDPLLLRALLIKLPISRILEYASANAVRREIHSAFDGFKRDLEAMMREAQASRVRIYPDETGTRGGAITGFFMQRKSTVRHQTGGTRVHVMTFGVWTPQGTSVPFDLRRHLREATQALQTKREKGKDINELTLISPGLYDGLLSLRRTQVEAEERARAAYREIAGWIEAMSQDIQETLGLIRGGQLVGSQDLSPEIVEGIAFSLRDPGGIPSPDDPIAAIFIWDVEERFVAVSETREHLVLRWPWKEDGEKQAQEEQE
jgi:hypothetical protein